MKVNQMRRVHIIVISTMFLLCLAAVPSVFAQGDEAKGAEAYKKLKCGKCHGDDGKGKGDTAEKLKAKGKEIEMHDWTDKDFMSKQTDKYLTDITVQGGKKLGKSKRMPPYEKKMKKENVNVDDLIAFVKSFSS